MIEIAVLDDMQNHLDIMVPEVRSYFAERKIEARISTYSEPEALLKDAQKNLFGIALVDINTGKETSTGIDTASALNRISPVTQIIFVSSYSQVHADIYQAEHIYMVPKPKFRALLPMALDKAMKHLMEMPFHYIPVAFGQSLEMIPEERIRYLEKKMRRIIIHADREHTCYEKFEDFLARTKSGLLYQCHRSYVVNISWILRLEPKGAVLKNQEYIPVSKQYYEGLVSLLTGQKKTQLS